ncbi:MAG: hypothetical protein RIK85_17555 [Marinobacter sp.]
MQTNYDASYLSAIAAMASEGMELRLLSARTLRQIDASLASDKAPGMNMATERAVRKRCIESLAVSDHHARALYSRDEGIIAAPEPVTRTKTRKGRIKG